MDRKAWVVAVVTLLFNVLQYADPERKVLSAIRLPTFNLDVFGLLGSLGVIVLLVMGFRRLERFRAQSAKDIADAALEFGKKLSNLETRMNDHVNKTGVGISDNLRSAADEFIRQLSDLRRRVDELERLPEGFTELARRMEAMNSLAEAMRPTFPIYRDGQIVKEWTKDEIRALPDSEKRKLKDTEPALWKWFLTRID